MIRLENTMSDDVIDVAPIASSSELSSPMLRGLAVGAAHHNTRQYVARIGDKESGYLSFDDRPDLNLGVIYQAFVLADSRSHGVGSMLLRFAEDVARQAGYSRVRLYPRPLDDGISETRLVEGYERRGYRHCQDSGGEMEKAL